MHSLHMLQTGQLAGTTRLKLTEGLREVPREIFDLADSLEILDLSGNAISTLPDDFGRLHRLRILFLSQNEFTELPTVLADCLNLTMIGFKSNRISSVPEGALPAATRWLILTDNQLETLPDSMGDLTALQKLMLAGNRLQALPESMSRCRNIELLRISANRLTSLPDWIFQLPKLAWLAFSGNPLTEPSAADLPSLDSSEVKIHEQLGEGASGWIHRATLHATESEPADVALKLFKGNVTSDGYPHDEMHLSSHIGAHPNLVNVMARYGDGKQLGLVMQLIESAYSTLGLPPSFETCTRDTFDAGFRISLADIANIAAQVASAMHHLHQRHLCHGDLYSHNLLVNDAAQVLLTDFGAATHYAALQQYHQQQIEKIETLAFGNLLDDLMQVSEASNAPLIYERLSELRALCGQIDVAARPTFSSLCASLEQIRNLCLIKISPNPARSPDNWP